MPILILLVTITTPGCTAKPKYNAAARINARLGVYYLNNNMPEIARIKVYKAIKLAPTMPEANTAMAYFLAMGKDNVTAEKYYKLSIKYSKLNPVYLNNYANFLCDIGRFEEAYIIFSQAFSYKGYLDNTKIYSNAQLCASQTNNRQLTFHSLSYNKML